MSQKKQINTLAAPKAIGPYSQAIETGDLVFVSGQLPVNPQTGELAENITTQTEQSLKNVHAVLEEAGCTESNVVKTTVFLKNMGDFNAMNKVYEKTFSAPYPARSAFEVGALPKDALVEIQVVAHR